MHWFKNVAYLIHPMQIAQLKGTVSESAKLAPNLRQKSSQFAPLQNMDERKVLKRCWH